MTELNEPKFDINEKTLQFERKRKALLKKYKAFYEYNTWYFPSVWNKDQFLFEYDQLLGNYNRS